MPLPKGLAEVDGGKVGHSAGAKEGDVGRLSLILLDQVCEGVKEKGLVLGAQGNGDERMAKLGLHSKQIAVLA